MATQVSIINRALRRIGAGRIQAITDNTDEARIARDVWDDTLKAMLAKFPWTFALKTSEVLAALETSDPQYAYTYALPGDCVKPLRILATGKTTDDDGNVSWGTVVEGSEELTWEIRGQTLVTDQVDPVILYVTQPTDLTVYTPLFIEALTMALAVEFCYAHTTKADVTARLEQIARMTLAQAMAEDGQRQKTKASSIGQSFVTARGSENNTR